MLKFQARWPKAPWRAGDLFCRKYHLGKAAMNRAKPQADAVTRNRLLLRTTRGRILKLLCDRPHTVLDLTAELGTTHNAVRAQLERLAREGFVHQRGSQPGVRRPHALYELSPSGRDLFPKAYEPVLRALAEVLLDNT